MKNRIAFICVGQAAGNIGELFAERGYNTFAINTSKEDISTLRKVQHSYHIPGGLGCSKDRAAAKAMLADCFDLIVDQIKSYVKEDIIYFIFSAGGGTGSGFSPWFIDILINDVFVEPDPDEEGETIRTKKVGVITILAAETESPQARENTYNCISELNEIDGLCNIFLIDNDKQKDLGAVNRIFVDLFDSMLMIPEKHKSKNGNIDVSEIVKGFTTPGVSVIAKVSGKADTNAIIERARHNLFAEMDNDPERKALSYVLSSTVAPLDYSMIIAEFGQYVDEFHTFNQDVNLVMLTGLSFPEKRIQKIESHLMKDAASISERNKCRQPANLKTDLNLLGSAVKASTPKKTTTEEKKSSRKSELLSRIKRKY